MKPPTLPPLACIDLCAGHAPSRYRDVDIASRIDDFAGACATRLFAVAVSATSPAIEQADRVLSDGVESDPDVEAPSLSAEVVRMLACVRIR